MQHNASLQPCTLAKYGLWIGVKTAVLLSTMYSVLVCGYLVVAQRVTTPDSSSDVSSIIPSFLFFMIYAVISGIIPSIFTGAVTGLLIGFCAAYTARHVSPKYFVPTGIVICISIALITNTPIWIGTVRDPDNLFTIKANSMEYVLFKGIPSIVYIVAGSVITNRYYHKWLKEKNSFDNSAAQQAVERSETSP